MAGLSKQTYRSALDCFRILQGLHENGDSIKRGEIDHKLRKLFFRLVHLKELYYSYFRSFFVIVEI